LIALIGEDHVYLDQTTSMLIQTNVPITYASPRIQYMLGLDGQTFIPTILPSNTGSPFIVIDTNLITGVYNKFFDNEIPTAGTIGSVSTNMFVYGSPFVLTGFSLTGPPMAFTDLQFSIKNIHGEPIRFHSYLKWTITLS
jgi:hypothetical protein